MPEYLSPGVYIEEISGPRPIEGVSTSTAGFVGQTERGPTPPRLVTSWIEYGRWYGGYIDESSSYMPFAIKGFFDNGGQRAFIARVHQPDASVAGLDLAQDLRLDAIGEGEWGNRIFVRISASSQRERNSNSQTFKLTVLYYADLPPIPLVDPLDPANIANPDRVDPDQIESYDNLGVDPTGPNYAFTIVNSSSQLVHIPQPAANPALPQDVGFDQAQLDGGSDGNTPIGADQYIGGSPPPNDTSLRRGLAGLEIIDEISLLCVPDHVHPNLPGADQNQILNEVVNQCERLKDRFSILNIVGNQSDVNTINPPRDSSYGAVYYPWIRVFNPRMNDTLLVPPGGHVCGIVARSDIERGVHKAPANEVVRGIINRDLNGNQKPLQYQITKGHQDILNPKGVNVIRDFRSDLRGIRLWGARTMSSDAEWKYVNVRRLFIFIEESIDEGTQWVVFEPNSEPTWAKVRRSITNFLISIWRDGALMGITPDEAFFVKCDRTTMTQDDIDNGRLICYIGIAPVKPAEFVIFRISQKTIEAEG
ncbi:MAG: phage tail sheath subtilisin-like domain-containing protein [Desulfobacterales bacterium]|jgi:hypothetical protein